MEPNRRIGLRFGSAGWPRVVVAVVLAGLVAACTPNRLDEPWPPDPATCLQHRGPDAAMYSTVRLATRGTYTQQSAHTAVVYFCFRIGSAGVAARLTTFVSGCVTQVSPSVIDVPGAADQYEAVPFMISICDQGRGFLRVGLASVDQPAGTVFDSAGVDITADDHGVLIKESGGGQGGRK